MNLTLIGMPGAGKSTIGKKLAGELKYNFIDIDKKIEKIEKKSIQKILDSLGEKGFVLVEEREILKLNGVSNAVISPGGSVIYSKKSMELLKKISVIIFLKSSLKKIKKRIYNINNRGIVGLREKGFEKLYKEREKLYNKYANIIINADLTTNKIIEKIKNSLKLSFLGDRFHNK